MEYYCYIYYDPRYNEPFYVGKGKNNRAWKHESRNKTFQGRIRKLTELGLQPLIKGKSGLTENQAFFCEKLLISVFGRKDLGTGPLFNHTNGGEGCSGQLKTDSHKENLRISATNIAFLPENMDRSRAAGQLVVKTAVSCVCCKRRMTLNALGSHLRQHKSAMSYK